MAGIRAVLNIQMKASPERQRLREAVANMGEAREDEAANERAKAAADAAVWAARRAVSDAEDRAKSAQQDATRALVSSYRGETIEPVTSPAAARADLDRALEHLAIVEAAKTELDAGRRGVLSSENHATIVRAAAAAVLRVEAAESFQGLGADVVRLQRELVRKSRALQFLAGIGAIPTGAYGRPLDPVGNEAISRLGSPPVTWAALWNEEDGSQPFRAAIAALQADPDAPIPKIRR